MQEDNLKSSYRKIENLHIVFWLFKDLAWCLVFRPLGLLMIFPTLIISIIITHKSRNIIGEFYHNLAVTLWIIANSYWMISEFYKFDELQLGCLTYKHLAAIPFAIGILLLAYYYLIIDKKVKH